MNYSGLGAQPAMVGLEVPASEGDNIVLNQPAVTLVGMACKFDAPLLLLTYLVTLFYFLLAPPIFFRKHDEYWLRDSAVTCLAVASVGTIIGTCVLAGFNRVYSLPHLVIFTTCAAYAWENRSRITANLSRKA
jgi:hypothetical protein